MQDVHGQAGTFQRLSNTLGQLQLILDQKNTHRIYLIIFVQAYGSVREVYRRKRGCEPQINTERKLKGSRKVGGLGFANKQLYLLRT